MGHFTFISISLLLCIHQEHLLDTYMMPTNVVPQNFENNCGVWAKIEDYVRAAVRQSEQSVVVVSGPLWLPLDIKIPKFNVYAETKSTLSRVSFEMLGSRLVAVPTHLSKLLHPSQ